MTAIAPMKDAARAHGLRYGAAHDWTKGAAPQAYLDLFNTHVDLLAPNLGWWATTPNAPTPDPAQTDPTIATFPKCQLTGAHFVWHEQIPPWAQTITDPAALQAAITAHINGMAAKYPGAFSWNVVNEVIYPSDNQPQSLRNTQFLKVLGPTFIDQAFIAAKAAMPTGPLLVINEYGLEENTSTCIAKRNAFLALCRHLKAAGAPVDAAGLQCHLKLKASGSAFSVIIWQQFLTSLAALGLKILITELDVDDSAFVGTVQDRDRAVAYYLAEFLGATLDNKAVVSVTTWDIADCYSWLVGRPSSTRADGSPVRPLPFDATFQPKMAYDMMLAAFNGAPAR